MNKENINILFHNYIAHFDTLNNGEHEEYFKWNAIGKAQGWSLEEDDLPAMLKRSLSDSHTLIDNRIVQPVAGIIALAKVETEKVRSAFAELLADDGDDIDRRQDHILHFVDACNALLEKHFPGKWKYAQSVAATINYLAMIHPEKNYLFKSSQAHLFAKYMEYAGDIGAGQTFKLKNYYAMCDELVTLIRESPELMAADAARQTKWKDESLHVLAYDLIYCMSVYSLTEGMKEPPVHAKTNTAKQREYRAEMARSIQEELERLQDQIDELIESIGCFQRDDFTGKTLRTRAFGMVTIKQQIENILYFDTPAGEKKFVLPGCIANGFLIPDDVELIQRYKNEEKIRRQVQDLENRQKVKMVELYKYQI